MPRTFNAKPIQDLLTRDGIRVVPVRSFLSSLFGKTRPSAAREALESLKKKEQEIKLDPTSVSVCKEGICFAYKLSMDDLRRV